MDNTYDLEAHAIAICVLESMCMRI